MDRLEFLKRLGVLTVGASLMGSGVSAMAAEAEDIPEIAADNKIKTKMPEMDAGLSKPVTVMVIGAGGRGRTYAQYAEKELSPYGEHPLACQLEGNKQAQKAGYASARIFAGGSSRL